jgi:Fe2+ transport system protein FeoA
LLTASSHSKNLKSGSVQTLVIAHIMPKAACLKIAARRPQNLYALCDLKIGDVGKVSFIRAESPVLENIFSMGFAFGAKVAVEAIAGDVLEVYFGDFNVLLGRDIAAKIFVELV